jgi:hypothetical protein
MSHSIRILLLFSVAFFFAAIVGGALLLYSQEDTQYAPRYSESHFDKITHGMDSDTVLSLLGPPLRIDDLVDTTHQTVSRSTFLNGTQSTYIDPPPLNGPKRWWYSLQGDDTKNYFVRVLEFDPSGKVVKVTKDYYVD